MPSVDTTSETDQARLPSTPLGCLLSFVVASLLFPPLWAGVNFAFGTALDGPIGVFLMEPPCQRLAQTTEPLSRYSFGGGWKRTAPSVCHFPSGKVHVVQRDGYGFTGREFVYLAIGLVGYLACFLGAFLLTLFLVVRVPRFLKARLGRQKHGARKGSKARKRRKR